jgi:hypothetical protein
MIDNGQILVDNETRISQLLRRFNATFPFLRLEILKKGEKMNIDHRDFILFDLSNLKEPQGFIISGNLSVKETEELFKSKLGLEAAIFRKMGGYEVETTFTSQWTLDHQNQKGQEICFVI